MAERFVRWTTKLATRDRSRVAEGLPTDYSVLGGAGWKPNQVLLPAVSA